MCILFHFAKPVCWMQSLSTFSDRDRPSLSSLRWLKFKLVPWACRAFTSSTMGPVWHYIVILDLDEMPHYGAWELAYWMAAKGRKCKEFLPLGETWLMGDERQEGSEQKTRSPPFPQETAPSVASRSLSRGVLRAKGHTCQAPAVSLPIHVTPSCFASLLPSIYCFLLTTICGCTLILFLSCGFF